MTNKTFMGFDIWFSNQPIFTHANKNEKKYYWDSIISCWIRQLILTQVN